MNIHNCQTDGIWLYLCKILLYSLIYSVMRCHQQLTWDSNIKIRNRFFLSYITSTLYMAHTMYIYIYVRILDRRTKLYGKPLTYLPFSHPFSHHKLLIKKKFTMLFCRSKSMHVWEENVTDCRRDKNIFFVTCKIKLLFSYHFIYWFRTI